jgi:hypothetical protein
MAAGARGARCVLFGRIWGCYSSPMLVALSYQLVILALLVGCARDAAPPQQQPQAAGEQSVSEGVAGSTAAGSGCGVCGGAAATTGAAAIGGGRPDGDADSGADEADDGGAAPSGSGVAGSSAAGNGGSSAARRGGNGGAVAMVPVAVPGLPRIFCDFPRECVGKAADILGGT